MDMGRAKTIYASGLFPNNKSAEQVYVKMLLARELDLPTTLALRAIYVTPDGTVGMLATVMKGLVKRTKTARFEYTETPGKCHLKATRLDTGEVYECEWTQKDAHERGIDKAKDGSIKTNWRVYGPDMLRARCDAQACRALWPDVLGGIYDLDELDQIKEAEVVSVTTSRTNAIERALGVTPPESQKPEVVTPITEEPEQPESKGTGADDSPVGLFDVRDEEIPMEGQDESDIAGK